MDYEKLIKERLSEDGTKLDLSYCNLIEIPECIGNLINLQCLNLSNNEIKEIPDSMGNLTNLNTLYLSKNPFEEYFRKNKKLFFFNENKGTQKLIKELLRLNELKRNSQLIYKLYKSNIGQTLPNSIIEDMEGFILLELKKSD